MNKAKTNFLFIGTGCNGQPVSGSESFVPIVYYTHNGTEFPGRPLPVMSRTWRLGVPVKAGDTLTYWFEYPGSDMKRHTITVPEG